MLPAVSAQQSAQQAAASSRQQPVVAPVGGLNTRDSVSALAETDAETMTNMVPEPGGVRSRRGYSEHLTGFSSYVETVAEYSSSTTQKMVCGSGTKLYTGDETPGAATELATGFTSARWQTAMHTSNMILCNGADAPQGYNGTSAAAISFSGSGLTTTSLKAVMIHHGRGFYLENNAPHFWYATTAGGFSGALAKFDLSQVASKGGNLKAFGSWSRDGGSGPDDFAVFVMSTGEVIVYAGTDPGDAANWSLVGRYYIGAPLDARGIIQYGADLYIMTKSDFVPMSQVLALSRAKAGITKLAGAAVDSARSYAGNTGWQAVHYPRGNLVLFNVPVGNNTFHQFGVNTLTGGAFKFEGWNASAFGVAYDKLYMGGNQKVFLCDDGLKDGTANIQIDVKQAFSNLRTPERKLVTAFSPLIFADGNVVINAAVAFDYGTPAVTQDVSSASAGPEWDEVFWDQEFWPPEDALRADVYGASGHGRSVSLRLRASLNNQRLTWYRTDYLYKRMKSFA